MAPTCTNANVIPFAVDRYGKWVSVRFTGIENPHILVVGGSQTGKTTTEKVIGTVAASRGNIVIFIDPKQRFTKVFREPKTHRTLPHCPVYRSEDPTLLAREAEGVLTALVEEMQRRYRIDTESDENLLADETLFPTILIVADEIGVLFELADKEWAHRRPEKYKGDTPCRELWHTLMRMGAEARLICMAANQTAASDELPAGTKTRKLCGHRIALGNTRDRDEWPMIAGPGVEKPQVPDGQKGAGLFLVGTNAAPNPIQCANIDTNADPGACFRLAEKGLPILEANGHVADGQLLLGGVPLARPGRMASQVAYLDPDDDVVEKAQFRVVNRVQNDPETDQSEDQESQVETTPETRMVVGNPDGAEFCDLSVANFRKLKALYPIPNETRRGNQPAWPVDDLREWRLQYADNRRNRARKEA